MMQTTRGNFQSFILYLFIFVFAPYFFHIAYVFCSFLVSFLTSILFWFFFHEFLYFYLSSFLQKLTDSLFSFFPSFLSLSCLILFFSFFFVIFSSSYIIFLHFSFPEMSALAFICPFRYIILSIAFLSSSFFFTVTISPLLWPFLRPRHSYLSFLRMTLISSSFSRFVAYLFFHLSFLHFPH